jgi:hypothetical protein
MKKSMVSLMVVAMLLMVPMFATAASLTGSIQGFMCVTQGKVCPIGKEDPMAAVENVFVLLIDAAKGEYYFVPNVDRAVLARHINEMIRVEGNVDMKTKSIHATDIYRGSTKVWSADLTDEVYRDLRFSTPPPAMQKQ